MGKNVTVVVLVAVVLASCTKNGVRQVLANAIGNSVDTQVEFSRLKCNQLQQQCTFGEYQEWQTSDKQMGCSCKKL
ncbi:hypothetical protein [Paraglaciecola aestuariivivens]